MTGHITLAQHHISAGPKGCRTLRVAVGVAVMVSFAFGATGCGKIKDRKTKSEYTFDGVVFKSKVEKVTKEDRSHFKVEVRKATQTLDGAKEAGRYAATRYCIEQYGSSKVEWISGPDQENAALTVVEDDLWLEGICKI